MNPSTNCGRGIECPLPVVGRIGKPIKDEIDPSVYVCLSHAVEAHYYLFEVEWIDESLPRPDNLTPLDSLIYAKHLRVTGGTALRTDRSGRWLPGRAPENKPAEPPADREPMTVPHP